MELEDFMPIPDLEACGSLLCIQPHPDDNEVGAGATIARLAAKGCRITYMTITDGRMGTLDPDADLGALAAKRRREAVAAARILGVSDLIFLDYSDTGIPDESVLCRDMVRQIRRIRPEFVMTVDPFLPYEVHPDHIKTGMAALRACMFGPFPHIYSGDGPDRLQVWGVKGIALYCSAAPNTCIDADGTWDLKIRSLEAHESQFDPGYLESLKIYLEFKSRQYGKGKGLKRAEAFKVLTPSHLHMNVDAARL
jgi:LmbE family N-acetylglucosaminyl deacetylase